MFLAILCLVLVGCSSPASHFLDEPLTPGRGLHDLVLGQTILRQAFNHFGKSAQGESFQPAGGRFHNIAAFRSDPDRALQLYFCDDSSSPFTTTDFVSDIDRFTGKLYGIRINLCREKVGRTDKGLALLATQSDMEKLYGGAQGTWVLVGGRKLHYYELGLVVETAHPVNFETMFAPAVRESHAKELAALDRGPSAGVVTSLMVCLPFKVLKNGTPARSGQLVVSGPPETTLEVCPF